MRDNHDHATRSNRRTSSRRSTSRSRTDGGRPPSSDASPPEGRDESDQPPQQWHQAPGAAQSGRTERIPEHEIPGGGTTPAGTHQGAGQQYDKPGQQAPTQSHGQGTGQPQQPSQQMAQPPAQGTSAQQSGQQMGGQQPPGQQLTQPSGQQPTQQPSGQQPTQQPSGQQPTQQPSQQFGQPQGQEMSTQPQGQGMSTQPQGQGMSTQPQGQFGQQQSQGQFSRRGGAQRSSRRRQSRSGRGGFPMGPAKIDEIVQTDVVTADRDTPVKTVVAAMAEYDVGSVVVVEDDSPLGIITDRQVAMMLEDTQDVTEKEAEDLLSGDLITGTADMTVFEALDRLNEESIRRLPIVDDDGSLMGLVTLDDILVVLGEEFEKAASIIEAQSPRI